MEVLHRLLHLVVYQRDCHVGSYPRDRWKGLGGHRRIAQDRGES